MADSLYETTAARLEVATPSCDQTGSSTHAAAASPPRYATPSAFSSPTKQLPPLEALDSALPPGEVVGPSQQVYRGRSLMCLRPADMPRRLCIRLIESWFFDPIVLVAIISNCVTMAWESPLDPVCEIIYLSIFTAELLLKIVAYGLIGHPGSYLRDPWCQLDFVVVLLAWAPIIVPGFGNYSVLRAFRALRPLRALKRLPGMQVLVTSILAALPRVANVLMLCGFITLVFAIVGVEVFKGSLHYRCALDGFSETPGHPVSKILEQAIEQRSHGRSMSARLLTPQIQDDFDTEIPCDPMMFETNVCPTGSSCAYFDANPNNGMTSFDSTPLALVSLLQALTFDDWTAAMFALMASVSPYSVIYFILIVIVGGFFVVNLFLAVIFEEFVAAEDASNGETLQTENPVLIPEGPGRILPLETHAEDVKGFAPPADPDFRRHLAELVISDNFNYCSVTLVVCNMVLMCMPYHGMPEEYAAALEQGSSFFNWTFVAEMLLKLFSLGCMGYWSDGWNALDGTIVSLTFGEMALEALFSRGTGINMSFLRIVRMIRVLRVLRLMRSWKGLYKIIQTFGKAMSLMSNMFILSMIFMVIFSLLGMQLFGGKFNEKSGFSTLPCPGNLCPDSDLSPHPRYHFDYFVPAMLTVFILMTGEWADAMEPATASAGESASYFYIAVVLVGRYIIMNLLIAIVLSAFSEDSESGGAVEAASAFPSPRPPGLASSSSRGVRESMRSLSRCTVIGGGKSMPDQITEDSRTALWFKALVDHPYFDTFIILAITASSVCLALDTPRLEKGSFLAVFLATLDTYLWPWLFLGELICKVAAFGFAFREGSYLSSPWNQLDFFIVITSFAAFASEVIPELAIMTNVRVLRVLRPLRLVSRNAGMKLVLTSLWKTMPAVGNVVGVVFFIQAVFAILGMQLYSGAMGHCTNPNIQTRDACFQEAVANSTQLVAHLRQLKGGGGDAEAWNGAGVVEWLNPRVGSFDNFGSAMLLLYVMSTGDEWEKAMFTTMDSNGKDVAPTRHDFAPDCLFSLMWMFIGSFFAMNLFVGVIVDNFSRIKGEENGSATMTLEQQQWVQTMRTMANQRPGRVVRVPSNPVRLKLFNLVSSDAFDGLIMGVIMAIVAVMACDYWGIEQDERPFELFNTATRWSAVFFYSECVLKILGLGPRGYFADGWCRFDFFLVCTTLIDEFASELLAKVLPVNAMLLRVLRVIRILRILRLLKRAKDVRSLILTMVYSFPSLINVCGILGLVTFMYAVLGVDLFTYLAHQENVDESRNFESLPNSALLLFQVLTGDAWSGIMADALASEDRGVCTVDRGDCGTWIAIPYFVSFQIIGSCVFLNLVVAVILENFTSVGSQDGSLVQASDVELFREVWSEFDPDADNYIPAKQLPDLCLRLPPPMGLKRIGTKEKAVRLCVGLRLQVHEGGLVAFSEVLDALINYNFKRRGFDPDDSAFASKVKHLIPPVPASPPPPSLPQDGEQQTAADKLAQNMADVSQRFALEVIAKYMSNVRRWKQRANGGTRSRAGRQRIDVPPQLPLTTTEVVRAKVGAFRRKMQTERSPGAKKNRSSSYWFPFTSREVTSAAPSPSKDML